MKKWHIEEKKGYCQIINEGGKTLGYSPDSGINIIEVDGYAFKDFDGDGILDPYEDWRLPAEERVKDLAHRLSIEEICGLMLYSTHQTVTIPDPNDTFNMRFAGTYNGKPFDLETGDIADLTDQQRQFLTEDKNRHVLLTTVENAATAARWNNNMQALCESLDHGIPVNISSDPRHGANSNGEFFVGSKGMISEWPSELGLAASFDPDLVKKFGKIMSKEYRAIGITTALSPQIDLASEPRWNHYNGTFGEGVELAIDLSRAYVDGCQTTDDQASDQQSGDIDNKSGQRESDGWGRDSVNAMVKHWPGGGTGEGGRDAHFNYGKYAVYPGDNMKEHMRTFLEGAFQLEGKTQKASALMPYYTISYNQDKKYGENVGNGYSKFLIQDLLRDKYGYDGVVCSDWGITGTCDSDFMICGMNWGVAHLSVEERHYKALMAGIDQFGGNNDVKPVLAAYKMGCAAIGEEKMRERMEKSAQRLLLNIMRPGLFENPYIDEEESSKVLGCAEFMEAGYEAQKKSIVMLKNSSVGSVKHGSDLKQSQTKKGISKNKGVLPLISGSKVYIPDCPETYLTGMPALFAPDRHIPGHPWLTESLASGYMQLVKTPEEADAAIVFMESPKSMEPGYTHEDGYMPISLQYRPYTATEAREHSIASGDQFSYEQGNTSGDQSTSVGPDRSYNGKTNTCGNESQLDVLEETRKQMGDKPVIVAIDAMGPMIMSEVDPLADAILMGFEISRQAYLDMIFGKDEPSGLLPFQIPADMATVEHHKEDVPRDLTPYTDSQGNIYDFAFGMNFDGVIKDERVEKYY